ncbi:MAG TPA: ABC transporter ATP-binding protein [Ilumatobacteraceae bacterium]|nr:ABC transporter ATP-binding protein [Ilumatobacteraceae bacterium]
MRGLTTKFVTRRSSLTAVDGVNLTLDRGETLGLVGESGSGKSLTCFSIMRLLPHRSAHITAGAVQFEGTDLLSLSDSEIRQLRGRRISMILQDPMTSLNPLFTVGDQLVEGVTTHRSLSRRDARSVARGLLERVQVSAPRSDPDARLRQHPHQLSGGQRQRVVGALALSGTPSLIIADEPTTSLDVTVQAQFLRLLKDVQRDTGAALLFVTHDLAVVSMVCDRVAVMYAGRIVETGLVRKIFDRPEHPYTQGLLRSVTGGRSGRRLYSIPGQPPALNDVSTGCSFAPRCEFVVDRCRTEAPPETHLGAGHTVRCWVRRGEHA